MDESKVGSRDVNQISVGTPDGADFVRFKKVEGVAKTEEEVKKLMEDKLERMRAARFNNNIKGPAPRLDFYWKPETGELFSLTNGTPAYADTKLNELGLKRVVGRLGEVIESDDITIE